VNIVKRAITEPLRMIAENAGEEGAPMPGGHGGGMGDMY